MSRKPLPFETINKLFLSVFAKFNYDGFLQVVESGRRAVPEITKEARHRLLSQDLVQTAFFLSPQNKLNFVILEATIQLLLGGRLEIDRQCFQKR